MYLKPRKPKDHAASKPWAVWVDPQVGARLAAWAQDHEVTIGSAATQAIADWLDSPNEDDGVLPSEPSS